MLKLDRPNPALLAAAARAETGPGDPLVEGERPTPFVAAPGDCEETFRGLPGLV